MTRLSSNLDRNVAGLLKAAEGGDIASQLELASSYYHGDGGFLEKNSHKSFYWFEQAAKLGSADAQFLLGGFYELGFTVQRDPEKSAYWYTQAAQQDLAAGHYALGMCCYHGFGVAEDKHLAAQEFNMASEQGDADAQYMLGICYEEGAGLARDVFMARQYFELSANQGYDDAMFALGRSLSMGHEGEQVKARYWLYEAVKLGHHEAHKLLRQLDETVMP